MRPLPLPFAACAAFLLACGGLTPPPATGTPPPSGVTRFIVGGDSRDDSAHVLPWAFREAKARGASAFLFLGDMELTPGLDAHFSSELPLLDPIPFYPALGNHEVKVFGFAGIDQAKSEDAFRQRFLGTPRTHVVSSLPGKVVYSVDLPGGVHFIALDNVSQNGFGADQLAWMQKDLEHARDGGSKYIVVGMHKPLAKNGASTHGMDADGPQAIAESDQALAMFEQAKVSLIVASHVHEYVALQQGGIPTYITGGLGAPLVGSSGPDHAFHHFLQVDVAGDGLHVSVVRFDGQAVMGGEATETESPRSILAAPDRSAEDRALDDGRRPVELFAFAGVQPGMRVAEIGAWKGYTAELLARAVAPNGTVYAQDPAEFDEYTRDTWKERAKREPFARIVRVARPYDDPLPPETAGTLDVAFVILFYHDMVWLKVDRAKMNAAIFRALKPGGTLVVVDHSARPNDGVTVAKSLHRIEESVVRDELTKAGFVLTDHSELLRHPEDPRDWSASDEAPAEKRGKSDRFVLRFKRP